MNGIRSKVEEHIDEFISWFDKFSEIDEEEIKEFRQIVTELRNTINSAIASQDYNILMDILRTLLVIAHKTISFRITKITHIALDEVINKEKRDEDRAHLMDWEFKYLNELEDIIKRYIDEFMKVLGFKS